MTQRDLLKILLVMAVLILCVLRCGGLSNKDVRLIEAGERAFDDTLEIKEPKL